MMLLPVRNSFTLLSILSLLMLNGCAEPLPDETQLRQQLSRMTAALEARELDTFIDPVAADFTANNQMDRRVLRWVVQRHFQTHESISVQLANVQVTLHENLTPPRATITFQALLSGGDWLPRQAGWYSVTTGWRKDGDELWQMISAEWRQKL